MLQHGGGKISEPYNILELMISNPLTAFGSARYLLVLLLLLHCLSFLRSLFNMLLLSFVNMLLLYLLCSELSSSF